MTLLRARNLAIGYGRRRIAERIDIDVKAGTVTCLLGPNGVGKTTLFRTLMGLIPSLSGSIEIAGRSIGALEPSALARLVAYVPQSVPMEFAWTVRDLVVMGRTAHLGAVAAPARSDYEIARAALAILGIETLADADAGRISGGQRQLVLIARALAQRAPLIMMDEPTASLDIANRALVLDTVAALAGSGLAIVVSTHEPAQAFELADQVVALGTGGGLLTGPATSVLTDAGLSEIYGLPLRVETTESGVKFVSLSRPAHRNII